MSVTDRDRQVAWRLYDRAGNEVDLADLESGIASYREELQATHEREVEGLRAALKKIAETEQGQCYVDPGMSLANIRLYLGNALRSCGDIARVVLAASEPKEEE